MVVVAAIAFIAVLTLTPDAPVGFHTIAGILEPWLPVEWVELLLNVLLFVPLGMAIGWFRRPWLLLGALAASVGFELLQGVVPDRNPVVRDVLTNTLGACLGYLAVLLVRRRFVRHQERRARAPR